MRQYKRPYFQTKQYWGLVEILKPFIVCDNLENVSIDLNYLIDEICESLKRDNPKFKKELFLKALKGDK